MLDPRAHWYYNSLDFPALWEEMPPPPVYFDTTFRMPAEQLRDLQNNRFLKAMEHAWKNPFYQRHWGNVGLEAGDIQSLDDLPKIPPYTVNDLRESYERHPPFGEHMGVAVGDCPLVMQTSGGTTGLPRPTLHTPRDREISDILVARRAYSHGIRPGDIVQVTFSMGLTNGGVANRDALWKYTGALGVMTGTGSATPTRRQIELARAWGSNVVMGFPPYLRHLAQVARDEMNFDVRELKVKCLGTALGLDERASIETLWGAPVFEYYGFNESGVVATNCELREGMHIFEDAHFIEVADPDTYKACPVGDPGVLLVTTFYREAAPIIRFNVNDVSAIMPGNCACGGTHRRIDKIRGRNDNMIKLRGVNVFPEAIGAILLSDQRSTGEYVCTVQTVGASARDEMTVQIEAAHAEQATSETFRAELEARVHAVLGVKVEVQVVAAGSLAAITGLTQTSKVKRLVDKRRR